MPSMNTRSFLSSTRSMRRISCVVTFREKQTKWTAMYKSIWSRCWRYQIWMMRLWLLLMFFCVKNIILLIQKLTCFKRKEMRQFSLVFFSSIRTIIESQLFLKDFETHFIWRCFEKPHISVDLFRIYHLVRKLINWRKKTKTNNQFIKHNSWKVN